MEPVVAYAVPRAVDLCPPVAQSYDIEHPRPWQRAVE
jgi:hypothetical protein